MPSYYGGTLDLTETMEALMSVAYIWTGITLVETDFGNGAEAAAMGRYYWPGNNVCWRYLVRVHVVLGYLGQD